MIDQLLAPFAPFNLLSTDVLLLLPLLIGLEAVLSADNAIALAAIARGLKDPQLQRRALDIGLVVAFTLRVVLILTATWVTKFWQFELAGAAYLLWLAVQYFFLSDSDAEGEDGDGRVLSNLWEAIPLIALTDLAFSLDSVTTAIALSKETWLVITGGAIGVLTLRFMAELFIRWLKEFKYLEDAGYLAVATVGLRLLLRVVYPDFVPPDWAMVSVIVGLFAWGFSQRLDEHLDECVDAKAPEEGHRKAHQKAHSMQTAEVTASVPPAVDSAEPVSPQD